MTPPSSTAEERANVEAAIQECLDAVYHEGRAYTGNHPNPEYYAAVTATIAAKNKLSDALASLLRTPSLEGQPVAWMVETMDDNHDWIRLCFCDGERAAIKKAEGWLSARIIPLYRGDRIE